uniref:Kazal-like domain-containing protein n=1 Tax=Ciona savignyi TaxID=51511 RepID=H2Y4W0_CIOSA
MNSFTTIALLFGLVVAATAQVPTCDKSHYADVNACPLHSNPICGSDGVTYGNYCFFCVQQVQHNIFLTGTHGTCQKPTAKPWGGW